MALTEKTKYISNRLIVDGTIEGDQISANTVTANKFSGAVEEEYYSYHNTITVPYGSQTTLFEFDFPEPEFRINKGRHIEFDMNLYISKQYSSTVTGLGYFYPQVQVPKGNTVSYNVGYAYPDGNPITYQQRAYFIGNVVNKIGAGQVYVNNQVKTYKNLRYQYDYELTELVTNGGLGSNTTGWTVEDGTLSPGYYAILTGISGSTEKAQISQAVTVTAGKKHRIKVDQRSSSTSFNLVISTTADVADAIAEGSFVIPSGSNNHSFDVDINVSQVYVILQNGSAGSTNCIFENISLKELQERTYIDISAYPSNPVPAGGAILAHAPFGLTASNSWVTFNSLNDTFYAPANQSSVYKTLIHKVYLGRCHLPLKCRLQGRHYLSSTTYRIQNLQVGMHSRIVEVVIPQLG
jgi:hypothetical protein